MTTGKLSTIPHWKIDNSTTVLLATISYKKCYEGAPVTRTIPCNTKNYFLGWCTIVLATNLWITKDYSWIKASSPCSTKDDSMLY